MKIKLEPLSPNYDSTRKQFTEYQPGATVLARDPFNRLFVIDPEGEECFNKVQAFIKDYIHTNYNYRVKTELVGYKITMEQIG